MWAIVPLKTLDRAKQRLASVLSLEERRLLMLAMARDVLSCLSRSSRFAGILIVSRTPEADALAQAFGTERFAESPEADLSTALTQARHYLQHQFGACGVFIVPADVPLIAPADIDTVLDQHEQITLVPDDERLGTNALVCSPADAMPFVFDGRSFRPHIDAAELTGVLPHIVPNPNFALDIDTPADLLTLLDRAPGSQTGTYLDKSGIAARLQPTDNSQPVPGDTPNA